VNHDTAFKHLLTTFFVEFLQAFLPEVATYVDTHTLEFLDKEVISRITADSKKREADLVVKAKFKGEETFFLVHVENQSRREKDFPKRMFRYFSRLHDQYNLPVYPIALFSYDTPRTPEPNTYRVVFPNKRVLGFEYSVVQLNQLSWRSFLGQPNPVATALMAKMQIASGDRWRVKLECVRLIVSMHLDPEKLQLIWAFVEGYLPLTEAETLVYEREFANLPQEEQEATMELTTSWERKGIQLGKEQGIQLGKEQGIQLGKEQGIHDGKALLLSQMVEKRFGSISAELQREIESLSTDQLDHFGLSLLGFHSLADLEAWFAHG